MKSLMRLYGNDIAFAASHHDTMSTIPGVSQEMLGNIRHTPWATIGSIKNRVGDSAFIWQKGLVKLVLRSKSHTVVFLGSTQLLSVWVSMIICRLQSKRVVLWTIGWLADQSGPRDWLKVWMYRLADDVMFYGHFGRDMAIKRKFDPAKLHVIYNSLDIEAIISASNDVFDDEVESCRHQMFGEGDYTVLGCCSRLLTKRELDRLIIAVPELSTKVNARVVVLLIGDGPEMDNLAELARVHHVDIHFPGAVYDTRKVALLNRCIDVTVAPGMVGLTAISSLAVGVPVVTHSDPAKQSPEYEAVIPGVNGELFGYGNMPDMINVLQEVIIGMQHGRYNSKDCTGSLRQRFSADVQALRIRGVLETRNAEAYV